MADIIIFDTETTGLNKPAIASLEDQPSIIEFAAIKLDSETLEEIGRLEFLVNPAVECESGAFKAHGIKPEQYKFLLGFESKYEELCEFFLGVKYMVAHNVAFDAALLKYDLERINKHYKFPWPPIQVCTIKRTFHMRNYRLNLMNLHTHLFGVDFKEAHRAMADVEALTRCFKELVKRELVKF